ncbi:hypothetical protein [Kribbella speibonae]|uniref:Uncharacterized protein n=1 Tax=Kribbella speibonae TaxID=1572660 RepID=A0A4R0IXS7_9ACTN|nr:hypothetical protein [Kribbella speibonae]TCC38871.1 hypothetical protein E0H92_21120 [Kribbella speibonae]
MWFLIHAGLLFVPRFELAKRDPEFANRPSVWRLRYPQPAWVRTTRASCFEQLTAALRKATGYFADAADVGRRLAGTTEERRPFGAEFFTEPRILPPPRWNEGFSDEPSTSIDAVPPGIDH